MKPNSRDHRANLQNDIGHFFEPSSIAIVGASQKRNSVGGLILQNVVKQGFAGKIYPVNPSIPTVFGIKCYTDLRAIPELPDLVVVAIPARHVLKEIASEAELGAKHVIIVSAGFKEIGPAGKILENEVADVAKSKRMRLLGPNCLGIYDNVSKLDTFFLPRDLINRPPLGEVSLASQSGSFIGHVMDIAAFEGLGIARVITYGNQIDICETDALKFFAEDSRTRVVGLYIEAVKDGKSFLEAANYCAKRKPLIILKTGRSESLSPAITSHTGAMAGNYSSYQSAFRKAGAIEVTSEIEFVDACKALSMVPRARGTRILVVGHAGGLGLTLGDICLTLGLSIPQISGELEHNLRTKTLPIASLKNPIDLTASGTDQQAGSVIEELLVKNKDFADLAIYLGVWGLRQTSDHIADILSNAMKKANKPVIVASTEGKKCIQKKKVFEAEGIPVFLSLERAARVAKLLCSKER